jgi:hypothetical protein
MLAGDGGGGARSFHSIFKFVIRSVYLFLEVCTINFYGGLLLIHCHKQTSVLLYVYEHIDIFTISNLLSTAPFSFYPGQKLDFSSCNHEQFTHLSNTHV